MLSEIKQYSDVHKLYVRVWIILCEDGRVRPEW